MRTSLAKTPAEFNPVVTNEKDVEVVTSVKLLGLNILELLCKQDITKGTSSNLSGQVLHSKNF